MRKLEFKEDKLNLGCGEFKKPGYVNVDYKRELQPDVVLDLQKFPYPFKNNSFSLIEADHVLEHLENPMQVMKEIHRIMKPSGKLIIRVPHFSRAFTHPEHKRGFDVSFPLYFDEKFMGGYSGTSFKLESMKLNWFAQPYLKRKTLSPIKYRSGMFLGNIFSKLANISPYFCSRVWCFLVGGFEEIEFIFRK